MAHEISLLDTIITQVGTDRAWHQLDKQKEMNGLPDDVAANQWGLGHEVKLIQLSRSDSAVLLDKTYGVFSDLNPDMFQVVGERKRIIQPSEFAKCGNKLQVNLKGFGCKIVSAGTIKGTRLGFISLDLGSKITLPGGDELKQYITLTISWDGSYKVMAVAMDYRTVCNNTYPSPECAERNNLYEHKHGSFDPQQVADMIAERYLTAIAKEKEKFGKVVGKLVDTQFEGVKDRSLLRFASVMADGKATLDRIVKMEESASNGSFLDRCMMATIDQDAWTKVKTGGMSNTANRIVSETLNGIGADMESAKGTLWGALNGYTFWTDHLSIDAADGRGKRSEFTAEERKQENVLFGGYNREKQNAILLLSAIANTPQ